jgi:glutamate synthase domain-containing protein 1
MCGIVGFLTKIPDYESRLGEFAVPMLDCMGDRGSDSAGLAVFTTSPDRSLRRYSLFAPHEPYAWENLESRFGEAFKGEGSSNLTTVSNHAILQTSAHPESVRSWLQADAPELHLLSVGSSIDIYKDTGHPREIADRYGLASLTGSHCVGHTRMATESAVTPAHSHPFTAGEDFCLVHNGSLSNPYNLRRALEKKGIAFQTDNDTEAACRFLQWRLQEGDTIEEALELGFTELDGFYTLLIGTADKMVLVRDSFACKPAIVAETDGYVAIGSEYRTLAHLPDIENADLFEPKPEVIYSWKV